MRIVFRRSGAFGGLHGGFRGGLFRGGLFRGGMGGGFRGGFRGGFHRGGWPGHGPRWHGIWGGVPVAPPTPDPQVMSAQACLAQVVNPAVPQDGIMGPQTRQALRTFQGQQQLPVTGMLDPNTSNALQTACAPPPPQDQGQQQPPQGGQGGQGGPGGGGHSHQHEAESFEATFAPRLFTPSLFSPKQAPWNKVTAKLFTPEFKAEIWPAGDSSTLRRFNGTLVLGYERSRLDASSRRRWWADGSAGSPAGCRMRATQFRCH